MRFACAPPLKNIDAARYHQRPHPGDLQLYHHGLPEEQGGNSHRNNGPAGQAPEESQEPAHSNLPKVSDGWKRTTDVSMSFQPVYWTRMAQHGSFFPQALGV